MSFLSLLAVLCGGLSSLFLVIRYRSREIVPPVVLLLLAVVIHLLEARLFADPDLFSTKIYVIQLEALLPLGALLYSAFFCRRASFANLSVVSRILLPLALIFAVSALWLQPDTLYYSPDFAEEKVLFLTSAGFFFYLGLMVFLVLSMVQLERTLGALGPHERWRIKFEVVAFFLLLGTYVVYFSQSLLYRSLDMNMLDARALALVLMSGLLFYSRLFRSRGEQIQISRGVTYRSMVLLAVGLYLVALGLLGEGMRYIDFPQQKTIWFLLVMVTVVAALLLSLSETIRRKLKVALLKNFYRNKYDYREQWMAFAEGISASATLAELRQAILELFSETFARQGASLYQLDPESGAFRNTAHFAFRRDWRELPPDDSLFSCFRRDDWVVDLVEVKGRLKESVALDILDAGGELVVPMLFDGRLVGFVVLSGRVNAGEQLTFEDYDLMRMLATQAIATLHGLGLAEQLSTTRELAAIGKVSTFVLHDLKNQVSGLSLMVDNAQEYLDDPEFQQDMLETVEQTVAKMKALITRLKNLKEKPEQIMAPVDLATVVNDAVKSAAVDVQIKGQPVQIDADEEEIYKVVLNLLLNAKEATTENSPIRVEYGPQGEYARLLVADSGCGMTEDFVRERLFMPFATTKKHGFGIGLYQCKQIVETHRGLIEVESRVGEGTTFTLLLPLAQPIEAA